MKRKGKESAEPDPVPAEPDPEPATKKPKVGGLGPGAAEDLPEGFFDDAKMDAKVNCPPPRVQTTKTRSS